MSDTAALIGEAVAAMPGSESAPAETTTVSTPSEGDGASEVSAQAEGSAATLSDPAPTEPAPTDDSAISPTEQTSGVMPLHRHKAVLTNTRTKYEAQLKAKDAELESLKWAKDIPDAQDRLHALSLAETDERQFVRVLKQLDPARYSKLQWADEAQPAQAATPVAQAQVPSDMPQPDVVLEDGSQFYSADGQKKLLEWQEAQFQSRMKSALDERFRPLDEQKQAQEMFGEAVTRTRPVIEDFRANKPLFKEHENEIKARVAQNIKEHDQGQKYGRRVPLKTLHEHYIDVVVPKLVANRDQMRRELLAEINSRPAAAATARTSAMQPAATGAAGSTASTADLIRASLAR